RQPPVRHLRQRINHVAVLEDHQLARTLLRPQLDLAVFAAAGQPPVRQHRQSPDPTDVRDDHRLARNPLRPQLDPLSALPRPPPPPASPPPPPTPPLPPSPPPPFPDDPRLPHPTLRPHLNLPVIPAARQPPVRQHRQRRSPASVWQNDRLACTPFGHSLI